MPSKFAAVVNEWRSALLMSLASLALLWWLPNQGFGPYQAINPFQIWLFVILITGISLVGYVAVRLLGSTRGLLMTGFFGGLASSTAVTLSFARIAKKHPAYSSTLAAGTILAAGTMFPRIVIEVAVINSKLVETLIVPLLLMMVISYGGVIWLVKQPVAKLLQPQELPINNPFHFVPALQFALLLIVIILATELGLAHFGDEGLFIVAALSGITDVDAITITVSQLALTNISESTAVLAIMIAAVTNTLVKAAIVWFIAGRRMAYQVLSVFTIALASGLLAFWL